MVFWSHLLQVEVGQLSLDSGIRGEHLQVGSQDEARLGVLVAQDNVLGFGGTLEDVVDP